MNQETTPPKDSFQSIREALAPAQSVLVTSHMRPDGDALGSIIAFALHMKSLGKKVSAWNEDGVPGKFHYLPHHEMVEQPPGSPRPFDAVVALDASTRERLGTVLGAISAAPLWINIDHHVSNEGYGTINHIDPSSPATGQILFDYLTEAGAPLDGGIAENLFAAIATDTGSFQYSGTSPATFRAAATLAEAGVKVGELSVQMHDTQPRRRFALLRHALNTAEFLCDDKIATFSLSSADIATLGVLPEDNEGIIDHLRSVEGVLAAAFYEELEGGKVRVSARSKDPRVDVCAVCRIFGGGGHPLAAGARVAGSLAEVSNRFNQALCDAIPRRD